MVELTEQDVERIVERIAGPSKKGKSATTVGELPGWAIPVDPNPADHRKAGRWGKFLRR